MQSLSCEDDLRILAIPTQITDRQLSAAAIETVGQNGVASIGQVDSDLMSSAGFRQHL